VLLRQRCDLLVLLLFYLQSVYVQAPFATKLTVFAILGIATAAPTRTVLPMLPQVLHPVDDSEHVVLIRLFTRAWPS
jgi:predicted exporter